MNSMKQLFFTKDKCAVCVEHRADPRVSLQVQGQFTKATGLSRETEFMSHLASWQATRV